MRNFDVAKRKSGFSLTEVLIVLAVLGFVASVILGVIKINSVKQFLAGRSMFTSDLATALSIMNIEHPLAKINDADKSVEFIKNFSDYFDIVRLKDFDTRNDIFSENIKDLAGDKVTLKQYDQYFVTKNGVSVALSYVKSSVNLPKFVQDQSRISTSGENYEIATQALNFVTGVYDLNGKKGPNVLGRDIGIIMPGYPINERAGEYFASTNTGAFFVAMKGAGGNPPEDEPGGPGGPGGSGDPGNPGNPPGDNPPKCDPNKDSNHCCPAGYTFNTTVCCPNGQKEVAPGVCGKDLCPDGTPRDENGECPCDPNEKTNECTLTEHQCQAKGAGWHLSNSSSETECGGSKNTCECECTLNCPSGQHLNKEKCTCETTPPQCENPSEPTGATCKTIKGTKIDWGYKCTPGAAFACINSGGTWDAECCRCSCAVLDKEINDADVCGLKGAYCVESENICSRTGRLACHYTDENGKSKLPASKDTYYTVSEDTSENGCFKCSPDSISGKGKFTTNGYEADQGNIGITKVRQKGKCGCQPTCDNSDKYQLARERLKAFRNITIDSKNACVWQCKEKQDPNKKDPWVWTGLHDLENACSYKCATENGTKYSNNQNWVFANDGDTKCGYECVKPDKPTSACAGDWEWIPGDTTKMNDTCKWKCSCPLTDTICEAHLKECVTPYTDNGGQCRQANEAYYAFYNAGTSKCASSGDYYCTRTNSACVDYHPSATGFRNSAYTCGSFGFSHMYKKADSFVTCDTRKTTVTAEVDKNTCKCIVKVTNNAPKDGTLAQANNKEYTYAYQGWNHWTGKYISYNQTTAYECTYSHKIRNDVQLANGKSFTIDNKKFTCQGLYSNTTKDKYIERITEHCSTFSDPIMLIQKDGENANIVHNKFNTNTDNMMSLGEDKIYWLEANAVNSHPFLVKKDSGVNKITSWGDIKKLMFTDMGNPSGVEELTKLAEATSGYLGTTNSLWNNLGVAVVTKDGRVSVKSLDDYNITEFYLKPVRVNQDKKEKQAGAIGNVMACYRMGVESSSIPGNGYERKTIGNEVKYCPKGYTNINECVYEQSNGPEKYSFNQTTGLCELTTKYGGNTGTPYFVKGNKIYIEKAFPYVDVMFISNSSEDQTSEPLPENQLNENEGKAAAKAKAEQTK